MAPLFSTRSRSRSTLRGGGCRVQVGGWVTPFLQNICARVLLLFQYNVPGGGGGGW